MSDKNCILCVEWKYICGIDWIKLNHYLDPMVKKYSRQPPVSKRGMNEVIWAVKASASDLRAHFKNTYEAGNALKGRSVQNAI